MGRAWSERRLIALARAFEQVIHTCVRPTYASSAR
jgi:Asp-tRNA(Asn)/Glu-tRNA(Gln) amidotransferase A subunit family amidase